MDDKTTQAQAMEIVGKGLSKQLGYSRATTSYANDRHGEFRFELIAHRSLSRAGFTLLMAVVVAINLIVGTVFMVAGAWPVLAFCGLDIALIYWAFNANYRSGRAAETIDLTPAALTLTRFHPSGTRERFEFNPLWVRVRLLEQRDGRNELVMSSSGEQFQFARFLSDDERRDFAQSLTSALFAARSKLPR